MAGIGATSVLSEALGRSPELGVWLSDPDLRDIAHSVALTGQYLFPPNDPIYRGHCST